ncbi:MAG: MFS transporter [Gammaproteobacteria bacterium]|nr:MFS transporter [Gammaproteobacteria bacterium]
MPFSAITAIWPLFFGLSLIGLALGVQGSLLGIRASLEGFDNVTTGVMMSSYFAGFLAGSMLAPRLIHAVGHIRTFGALTALASMTILVHSIVIEPWTWSLMRLLTGFAMSAIYVVAESWLNQIATNENRGQVLATYMVILLAGICGGQFLLNLADPGGFALFAIISLMVSLAAIPILLTATPTPEIADTGKISIRLLWQRAPMGIIGIVLSQWCCSAVFGMGAVYATQMGFSVSEVANFMAAMLGGGMLLQWPLGRMSDMTDRRWVIGLSCTIAMVAAYFVSFEVQPSTRFYALSFVFGGFTFSLYSLAVSLMNDHLRQEEAVPASGTIVLVAGLASISGPVAGAFCMDYFGLHSFFLLLASSLALLGIVSFYRALFIPAIPSEFRTPSTLQPATTLVGTVLHAEEEFDQELGEE